jgi:hypothetical protein
MSDASSKRLKRSRKHRKVSNPLTIIPSTIPLVIKIGFIYLRFKRKAKKAGKVFEKEMVANGVDKTTAKLLRAEYVKGASIMRGFDFSDMMNGSSEKKMIEEYS